MKNIKNKIFLAGIILAIGATVGCSKNAMPFDPYEPDGKEVSVFDPYEPDPIVFNG